MVEDENPIISKQEIILTRWEKEQERIMAKDAAEFRKNVERPLSTYVSTLSKEFDFIEPKDGKLTESEEQSNRATKKARDRRNRPTRRDPHQKPTPGGGYQTTATP
jgi:hypothetical protein